MSDPRKGNDPRAKMGVDLIYVPETLRPVVERVQAETNIRVFYEYGHYAEVVKQLRMKEQGMNSSETAKYPLIWLVMDFPERQGEDADIYAEVDLNVIIAVTTEPHYSMPQRRDKSYLPVLYPIYASFIKQLSLEKQFSTATPSLISRVKYDRPFWDGGKDPKGNNLFGDFCDAIEIRNLNLKIKQKKC